MTGAGQNRLKFASLQFDSLGNSTGIGAWSFTYDGENRLRAASGPTATVTYGYDRASHLASRASTGASGTVLFVYSGSQLAAEYDGTTGNVKRRYILDPMSNVPLAQISYASNGTPSFRFLHQDAAGSVIAESDAAGAVLNSYTYGPFGEPSQLTGPRYRYTGQLLDEDTGLYDYRARAYSPRFGRFLQPDPAGSGDNLNLYAYVGNDPVNAGDPSGLAAEGIGNWAGNQWAVMKNTPDAIGTGDWWRGVGRGYSGDMQNQALGPTYGLAANLAGLPSVDSLFGPVRSLNEATGGQNYATVQFVAGLLAGRLGASGSSTTLFRAVSPSELADISATGKFRNLGSSEGKYFTISGSNASFYAKQAVSGFGDPAYTIVSTRVSNSTFRGLAAVNVDRGIPAYVLPDAILGRLKPIILNYSPVFGW
jgi:RHS repeat-associated protein